MGLPYRRYIDDQVWVSSEAMGAEDEAQYQGQTYKGSWWIRGMPNDASTGVSAILLVLFLRALSIVGIRILIASAFEKSINTRKVNDVDLIQSSKCCERGRHRSSLVLNRLVTKMTAACGRTLLLLMNGHVLVWC